VALPVGTLVTTRLVQVVRISCPSCDAATVPADYWIKNTSTLRVHVPVSAGPLFNVKKQVGLPIVGMRVVVQGVVAATGNETYIVQVRFGEGRHDGPHRNVTALARGTLATGTYAWLLPARVLSVGRWPDGDYSFDVAEPGKPGFVHVELSPPFSGQLHIPHVGDSVAPYGYVRYDADHSWWEIHPVRCWSTHECVPVSVASPSNAPPPGTPVGKGGYIEGKPPLAENDGD
jgi:hypothetical protein